MAQRSSGVEAGVLAGDKSTRIFIRILIRCGVVGRGRVFPPPVGVALIIFDSVCCTSITKRFLGLKRERAGSSWPMSSHPITHPPSSLISSLALLPSPQKTPSVGRHRVAPPAARFCLPSLVAALEFLFFLVDISKWKFPRKSRRFLTSGVFESVRFKRKRGRVERVQAGLAVEEGGEASNPPRGGGGETEVDRSAAGAQRAAANEVHGGAKQASALFCQRQKESREEASARLSTSEWQRLRWRNFKSTTNFCH